VVASALEGLMGGGAALAVVAALAVATTACGGSGADKAGGQDRTAKRVVLTLAVHDSGWGAAEFAEAVAKRSRGSMEIRTTTGPKMDAIDWERRTVEDVRAGRVELGLVGARVWDTLGVESFQSLLAPFLIDELGLERRVLASGWAASMLGGVDRAGVVGIALLPGPLRRPFGHTDRLVGRADYEGRTIGVVPGDVEAATFRALGAVTRRFLSLHPSFFTGAALDASTIVEGGYRGKTLVANVVLWSRPETIVMNRRAFAALTSTQQKILLEAGRAAVGPRTDRLERSEEEAVRALCTRHLVSLVSASSGDVAQLLGAVRPVYAQLERDSATRRRIDAIRGLRAGLRGDPLRCPEPGAGVAHELEGRWRSTLIRSEVPAAGAPPQDVPSGLSVLEIDLEDRRWTARGLNTQYVWTGRYAVSGAVMRLTIETCSHNPCTPGAATEYRWSVYRDELSLRPLPGRASWPRLVAMPFTRVR
jgi:C4-dicarboxylate-binding protein DctP